MRSFCGDLGRREHIFECLKRERIWQVLQLLQLENSEQGRKLPKMRLGKVVRGQTHLGVFWPQRRIFTEMGCPGGISQRSEMIHLANYNASFFPLCGNRGCARVSDEEMGEDQFMLLTRMKHKGGLSQLVAEEGDGEKGADGHILWAQMTQDLVIG